jgi:hypothetical protein
MLTYPWSTLTPHDVPQAVVSWRDIRYISAWDIPDEEIRPARRLDTLGWVLHDGPDPGDPSIEIIVTAGTYDWEEHRWSDYTVYPKLVIKKVDSGDNRRVPETSRVGGSAPNRIPG